MLRGRVLRWQTRPRYSWIAPCLAEACRSETVPATTTYHVKVPVIVNTERLEADTQVILKWKLASKKEKVARPGAVWSDEVAKIERKRRNITGKAN